LWKPLRVRIPLRGQKQNAQQRLLPLLSILLMRQLKIVVLSVLVVTDKLELGEPQASGIQSP